MTDFDTLNEVMAARYSCRAFRQAPVSRETITQIVQTARQAPSWSNVQPWQLVITDGSATDVFRTALQAEAAQGISKPDLDWPTSYSGIYADRRRTCGWQLYDAVGVQKGDRDASSRQTMENFALFGAPHVAIVTSPVELGPYGAVDSGGFITAFALAATALGVATVPQAAVAAFAPMIHNHFDIPEDRLVLCAISFGYADKDHPANGFRTERASTDAIIDWRD